MKGDDRAARPARGHALGIDIGGTFTDFALLDQTSGELHAGKVLTNYADLAAGVLDGTNELLQRCELPASGIQKVVHGTTLVTNALIERRGANTALVVTRGVRDILEMARESRYDIFDIDIELPSPLVPRRWVFEVRERLDAHGSVLEPLSEADVESVAGQLKALDIKAVAICFLHSFRNAAHERAAGQIFARIAPEIAVSLSSDVMSDIREYERASTTAANAYVQPIVRSYLDRLVAGLKSGGVDAEPFLIGSDGSRIARETAIRYPVRLVESGPAGGALAAAYFAKQAGLSDVIAFDMGGTTAKVCVIDEGEPERSDQFEVARVSRFAKGSGLPLKVPVMEMIEIGAGGGSIAHIDEVGLLRVGPESSSAEPGPACYGRGGSRPTVTDADLFLGYLDPAYFLGGAMSLDVKAAAQAIERDVAKPLNLTTLRAAWGIHAVVNDNMARAAKVHCLERGKDPRDYVLVAYGGAGPVHAWQVAAALGIPRVLYPMRAGVMSAFGFLVAPAAFQLMRADAGPLESVDPAHANAILDELEAEATALVNAADVTPDACQVRREAALRFTGQSYALSVTLPPGRITTLTLDTLRDAFLASYRDRYHRLRPNVPIELVNWRVSVAGPRVDIKLAAPAWKPPSIKGTRPVYFPEQGDFVDCPIYDRLSLTPGQRIQGPVVIEEPESTVVIGPGGEAEVDNEGNILAILPGAPASLKRPFAVAAK